MNILEKTHRSQGRPDHTKNPTQRALRKEGPDIRVEAPGAAFDQLVRKLSRRENSSFLEVTVPVRFRPSFGTTGGGLSPWWEDAVAVLKISGKTNSFIVSCGESDVCYLLQKGIDVGCLQPPSNQNLYIYIILYINIACSVSKKPNDSSLRPTDRHPRAFRSSVPRRGTTPAARVGKGPDRSASARRGAEGGTLGTSQHA